MRKLMTKRNAAIVLVLAVLLAASAAAYFKFRPKPAEREIVVDYSNVLAKYFHKPPILYIEAADAAKIIAELESARDKSGYLLTANYTDFEKSKLCKKLGDRFADLSKAAGFTVTVDGVKKFTGRRSAFLLFDIAELKFVYVSELSRAQWLKSNLNGLRKKYDVARHAGVRYYVRENKKGGVAFMFARVGGVVLMSNDKDFFLAYLEDIKKNGPVFAKSRKAFRELFDRDIRAYELAMYVDRAAIDNLYFRNYWVFGNSGDFKYILNTLITVKRGGGGFVEDRISHFAKGAVEATPGDSPAGLTAVFPSGAAFVEAEKNRDAVEVADNILLEIMGADPAELKPLEETKKPEAAPGGEEKKEPKTPAAANARDEIAKILNRAAPLEYGYFADADFGESPWLEFDRAVAVRLKRPRLFDTDGFAGAVSALYADVFLAPGGPPPEFERTKSGGATIYSMVLPLFESRSVAFGVRDGLLVVGNNPKTVAETLARKPREAPEDKLIERTALYRVPEIAKVYVTLMNDLGGDSDWDAYGKNLFRDNIGSLVKIGGGVKTVTLEQRIKNDTLYETARYSTR